MTTWTYLDFNLINLIIHLKKGSTLSVLSFVLYGSLELTRVDLQSYFFCLYMAFRGLRCSWEGLALLDGMLPTLLLQLGTYVHSQGHQGNGESTAPCHREGQQRRWPTETGQKDPADWPSALILHGLTGFHCFVLKLIRKVFFFQNKREYAFLTVPCASSVSAGRLTRVFVQPCWPSGAQRCSRMQACEEPPDGSHYAARPGTRTAQNSSSRLGAGFHPGKANRLSHQQREQQEWLSCRHVAERQQSMTSVTAGHDAKKSAGTKQCLEQAAI